MFCNEYLSTCLDWNDAGIAVAANFYAHALLSFTARRAYSIDTVFSNDGLLRSARTGAESHCNNITEKSVDSEAALRGKVIRA